jgi:hypothetical protein
LGGDERASTLDVDEAIATALQAHEDGLFQVVVDDRTIDSLDDVVQLHDGSQLLFLRLVALSGG